MEQDTELVKTGPASVYKLEGEIAAFAVPDFRQLESTLDIVRCSKCLMIIEGLTGKQELALCPACEGVSCDVNREEFTPFRKQERTTPPATPLIAGAQPDDDPDFTLYGYGSPRNVEYVRMLRRQVLRQRRMDLKEKRYAKSEADSKSMRHIKDLMANPALANYMIKNFRRRRDQQLMQLEDDLNRLNDKLRQLQHSSYQYSFATTRPEEDLEETPKEVSVKLLKDWIHNIDQLNTPSFGNKMYRKSSSFVRKAIKVLFNGEECFARPDSKAEKDICSEEFAKQHGLAIRHKEEDKELFQLGHGKFVRSIGCVEISCALPKDPDGSTGKRWFHVIKNCPAPVIMGIDFLQQIQLYTKNKHLLVKCPSWFGNIPTLKWIGAPQGNINFSADGNVLSGCADTGSDLDFMSLKCAMRNKFTIDRSDMARTLIQVGDGSKVETVGTVHISSIQLGYFDEFEMNFHILPGLPCDVIFSEEFVEQMDAFNTCVEIIDTEEPDLNRLNTLINLGPIQAYIALKWAKLRRKQRVIPQQESTSNLEIELYHRNRQEHIRSRGNFWNTQHPPPDITPSAPTIASTVLVGHSSS